MPQSLTNVKAPRRGNHQTFGSKRVELFNLQVGSVDSFWAERAALTPAHPEALQSQSAYAKI